MNPLRAAAEWATLAMLHEAGDGITLDELLAEARVLARLAETTTRLGTPWAAALEVFTTTSPVPPEPPLHGPESHADG